MNRVKKLSEMTGHITNEEKAEHTDAEKALKEYPKLDLEPPKGLNPTATAEWQRLTRLLSQNTPVSDLDRVAIEVYVKAYATYTTAMNAIRKGGLVTNGRKNPYLSVADDATKTIRAIGNDLGLSISSRQRLELNKAKQADPKDPFEAVLSNG